MIEKYKPRKPMTFERKIKEISDSKNLAIVEREKIKKELIEAIEQDQDSRELYKAYGIKSEEIRGYDDKINDLKDKRVDVRNMLIYSKTPEGQDELLAGDEVYQLLKDRNNKELLNALMERKMSVDQYKELSHFGLADEQRILRVMDGFNSGFPLKIKVGKKGNGRGYKTINERGKFETEIGEEYVLTRLSRHFSRTGITQDDLKAIIKFPEGVKITEPQDTKIKFECGNMKGTIKVEFTMSDLEVVPQNTENPNKTEDNNHSMIENREKLPKNKPSPKELYDSLEEFIKWFLRKDNLKDASNEELKYLIGSLEKDETMYEGFCKECAGKILKDNSLEFPSSFKEFLDEIAPIKLDEEKLLAILQSNYKIKGDGDASRVLVFDAKCFRNYSGHPELGEKYKKRSDYIKHYSELTELQKEELGRLKKEITQIERSIINTYYPHLKEAYFKHEMNS